MGNGMIQAEIREGWNRHPPLLTAGTFHHPVPWVCPILLYAMNEEQWLQFPTDRLWAAQDSQGCPSPSPECTAHVQHIIPASLHPRKGFAHQEGHPQLHHERVTRAVTSGTQELRALPWPQASFPSLPPPRVALIIDH